MNPVTERDVSIPFGITVPPNWTAVDPSGTGVADAVFAATRETPAGRFRPNVIVTLRQIRGEADLLGLADAAAGRLATQVDDLTVADRGVLGDHEFPAIAQVLRVRAGDLDLVQSQVHLVVPLTKGADGDRLVAELACTCGVDGGEAVRGEFAGIVDSFHVRTDDSAG